MISYLQKVNSVAKPGYNRWLVPIAALSIHLCIGQIYAFSVFNEPLKNEGWKLTELGWIFTIALFFLGASAAVFGKWVERVGPRKTMFVAALCFSSGFMISAFGIHIHNIWFLYLGSGLIGGIGLGLGYISPVSTLIKWFPDRPGMATGMAIMGFGGGAMIASPLSVFLMDQYSNTSSNGIMESFLIMGCIYLILMVFGSIIVKIPDEGWRPKGFKLSENKAKDKMITTANVLADTAIKTPQFKLLFLVLMLNVTAGIGVLSQADVMVKEIFEINKIEAASFVALLSLFNMLGRFIWSSLSDYIGRKNTYTIFFVLGMALYIMVPFAGNMGSVLLFSIAFSIILSMYGGGFATIPAYLKDMFGTKQVGAIHGRLLLAWSLAAILGPVTINYLREYQLDVINMPKAEVYNITMYLMAGLLLIGLICNLMVKPVDAQYHDQV